MRNEDRIIAKLVEMDAKLDTMVTRDEFERRMDQVVSVLDGHTSMLERLDQERLVSAERITRIEQVIGSHRSF